MFWARIGKVLIAVAVGSAAQAANGELITFEYGGVIDTVNDPHELLGGTVQVGDPFSGIYTFDPNTPDSLPDDPQFGLYESISASYFVSMGGLVVGSTTGSYHKLLITNDHALGDIASMSSNGYESGGFYIGELAATLQDSTASVFDSDALPSVPPDINAFDFTVFHLNASTDSGSIEVVGTVTYLVPEAGTFALVVVGMILVPRFRRREAYRITQKQRRPYHGREKGERKGGEKRGHH